MDCPPLIHESIRKLQFWFYLCSYCGGALYPRRPDNYWLWIIIMGGGLGALIYIAVEVLPDLGLLRHSFQVFSHRKRIRQLEMIVLDNPSAGNYEELADLYLEQKNSPKQRNAMIAPFRRGRIRPILSTGVLCASWS